MPNIQQLGIKVALFDWQGWWNNNGFKKMLLFCSAPDHVTLWFIWKVCSKTCTCHGHAAQSGTVQNYAAEVLSWQWTCLQQLGFSISCIPSTFQDCSKSLVYVPQFFLARAKLVPEVFAATHKTAICRRDDASGAIPGKHRECREKRSSKRQCTQTRGHCRSFVCCPWNKHHSFQGRVIKNHARHCYKKNVSCMTVHVCVVKHNECDKHIRGDVSWNEWCSFQGQHITFATADSP